MPPRRGHCGNATENAERSTRPFPPSAHAQSSPEIGPVFEHSTANSVDSRVSPDDEMVHCDENAPSRSNRAWRYHSQITPPGRHSSGPARVLHPLKLTPPTDDQAGTTWKRFLGEWICWGKPDPPVRPSDPPLFRPSNRSTPSWCGCRSPGPPSPARGRNRWNCPSHHRTVPGARGRC